MDRTAIEILMALGAPASGTGVVVTGGGTRFAVSFAGRAFGLTRREFEALRAYLQRRAAGLTSASQSGAAGRSDHP